MSAQTVLAEPSAPVPDAVSPAPASVSVQELAAKIDHIAVLLAELKAGVLTFAFPRFFVEENAPKTADAAPVSAETVP